METTILLVDDHPVFRKGLLFLLGLEEDMSVVGEAGDGQTAIDLVREFSPDVVIMDITMPNLDGIKATRHILSEFPDTKIIALSIHSGKSFVEGMLCAGALGYLLKESAPEELVKAIRTVMQDEMCLSTAITSLVVTEYKEVIGHTVKKETAPILRTKLYRPTITDDIVIRTHLINRLEKNRNKPLTLVSAPAGYGKSILISSWLEEVKCLHTWLSLDEEHNDLHIFLAYFVAAVKKTFPEKLQTMESYLKASVMPPLSIISRDLINALDQIDDDFVMVLDDFHLIGNQQIFELINILLWHPLHNMHLVILTRRDPSLSLSELRSYNRMNEIRMAELSFTRKEVTLLFNKLHGIELSDTISERLLEKTEGWIVGLRLVLLGIGSQGHAEHIMGELKGDMRLVSEFLVEQVLRNQPIEIQDYLLKTSILNRFCSELVEALKDIEPGKNEHNINGQEFIKWLVKTNLFVITMDEQHKWFRYHHLFQRLLTNQLEGLKSPEEIATLNSRASGWFAEKGMIEEALQHALAAGDKKYATALVAHAGPQLMDNQEWPRLERWLHMLPHEQVEQSPELLILKAWIYHIQHNLPDMGGCLQKVEALKATSQPNALTRIKTIQGHYEALCGIDSYMKADGEQALTLTQRACEKIPEHHKRALVFAHIFQLGSHQILGDFETGLSIYKEVMTDATLSDGSYQHMLMANLGFAYWIDADLISLRQAAECVLRADHNKLLPETAAMGNYFLGVAHYCLNDLDRAEEKLSRVIDEFYTCHTLIFVSTSFALALVCQAKGKPGKARKYCEAVVTYAIEADNSIILQLAQAFTAELALRQGRLAEASQWAKQFHAKPFLPTYLFYMPQLTLIKTLLAQDTTESRQQAAELLDELHAFQASIHNKVFLIDVLALQALFHEARGEEQAALDKLTEAIALAEPGGFIRLFVDMGPRMAYLLERLIGKNVAVDYIGQLLAALREDERRAVPDEPDYPTDLPSSLSSQPLVEPLTNREIEILELLDQRLQNKEIAEKLFISPETVKAHLKNIFQKLHAGNRREVVSRAKGLGVL